MLTLRTELARFSSTGCSVAAHLFLAALATVPFAARAGDGETHLVIEGKVTVEVEAPAARAERTRAVVVDEQVKPTDALQFETDRAEPLPTSLVALQAVAQVMATHPTMQVRVEAHADDAAGAAYNQQLSQRRARWVQQWLVRHGVDPASISAQGFGSARPVASNQTEAGRAANRRVEFVITAH